MKLNLKIVAATAAVAMMSSGAAYAAGTIGVTPAGTYTYSKEGLTLTGTGAVTLPNIVVTFGNNLTYQDDILITLPGTTSVAPTNLVGLVTCTLAGSAVGYVTTINGGWNFRVTAVAGITIGDSCTFTGLQVQGASLANGAGTLNYQANRFGVTPIQIVDNASSSSSIVVKSQYGIAVQTALNATIDVYQDRLAFLDAETVGAGGAAVPATQADSLQFTTTVDGNGTTFTGPVVTTTAQTVTINGDFNWTDTASPAGTCFDSGLVNFVGWSVAATSTCASAILVGPTTNTTQDGYFFVPGTKILNPTDWTGGVEWSYSLGSATGKTGLSWDPGIWDINGAQVYIHYMPYGEGIGRIVFAANTGLINADVTADIYYNGNVITCNLGNAMGRRVTRLSTALDDCVIGAGIESGRVAILLTFTAPDKDIEVYSAYNVGGSDRGTVVNTSNGRAFFYGLGF